MAFKILGREYVHDEEAGGKDICVCDILCDEVADLPTAEEIEANAIGKGSWAWVANAKAYAVLNLAGEWVGSAVTPEDPQNPEDPET